MHRILFKKQTSFKDFVMIGILKIKYLILHASAYPMIHTRENSVEDFSLKRVTNGEKWRKNKALCANTYKLKFKFKEKGKRKKGS